MCQLVVATLSNVVPEMHHVCVFALLTIRYDIDILSCWHLIIDRDDIGCLFPCTEFKGFLVKLVNLTIVEYSGAVVISWFRSRGVNLHCYEGWDFGSD